MNTKFDELAKGLAQSATRRQALKKFGIGLAGMALACFGLAVRATAGDKRRTYCAVVGGVYTGACVDPVSCASGPSSACHAGRSPGGLASLPCFPSQSYDPTKSCSFFLQPF